MIYVSPEICTLQVFKDLSGPSFMGLVKVLGWISENRTRDKIPVSVVASDLGLDSGIVEELCNTGCLQFIRSSAGCFYRVAGFITGVITRVPKGAGVHEF
ncbi:hypothetical protein F4555_000584 [Mobiluncus mulieris]|uniref:Uncharacterized protein n=1 Tax=Mobiluncus mulieris TaxID=2052 RepID=A0A7Y0Y4B9_9ACTO|nr:hypothetical protein [Mobiluncus mulieris]MBB5845788.1 hypothetical protein [Mobiluncus mulieris]MCV0011221.1 hypothetical protein [Mobiluncus mulieris]NMW64744.1 hypothetical protein [Mobiluncus mulieris]STO15551.1 Uncharacterised protein [Mobiluncus mulieris]